jgi:hypothetical protein
VLWLETRTGGGYVLWVDDEGKLRIGGEGEVPSASNDKTGTVVGTQIDD